MPRRIKTPILSPIRAYYLFERKKAVAEEKALATRARKRRAKLKDRLETKAERDSFTAARMNRDIDKIRNHPSKLAVKMLRDMVRSSSTPAQVKVRAAGLIAFWATGDFDYGQKRRRKA